MVVILIAFFQKNFTRSSECINSFKPNRAKTSWVLGSTFSAFRAFIWPLAAWGWFTNCQNSRESSTLNFSFELLRPKTWDVFTLLTNSWRCFHHYNKLAPPISSVIPIRGSDIAEAIALFLDRQETIINRWNRSLEYHLVICVSETIWAHCQKSRSIFTRGTLAAPRDFSSICDDKYRLQRSKSSTEH